MQFLRLKMLKSPFHTFSTNVDDEKNLASLREISNFAHNNLLNILKL